MTSAVLPCPFLVGGQLCSKPRGHRWRHKPGPREEVPEISGRRLDCLGRRFGLLGDQPRGWWERKARCPACRAVITGIDLGAPTGPVLVAAHGERGPCVDVVSEYEVRFWPCGHRFRRVMRPKDFR